MKNDDNKKVDSNDNLDELMKSATEKVSYDGGDDNKKKSKSTKKVVISTVIGLLLFGAALTVGAFMMGDNDIFEDKTKNPDWVGKEDDGVDKPIPEGEWDFDHPVELDEWAQEPFDSIAFWESEDNLNAVLDKSQRFQGLSDTIMWVSSGLPHGYADPEGVLDDPYTNDLTKEFLEDGSENPQYSYALREDYQKAYVTYTERLLNPIFGEWIFAQRANMPLKDNKTYNALSSMFTNSWWSDNVKEGEDYTGLPILVDWEGNDWDGIEFAERETGRYGTFFGRIVEDDENRVTSEIIGYDVNLQTIVKVNSPVEYYAFGKDEKVIHKKGTLEITLMSNSDSIDIRNRVVISDAKLSLD